MSEMHVLK